MRHGTPTQNTGKVYCVTYTGRSEVDGRKVILRGCEHAELDDFRGKKCVSSGNFDFIFPRLGHVRNVEKCYCNGNNCNAASSFSMGSIALTGMLCVVASLSQIFK